MAEFLGSFLSKFAPIVITSLELIGITIITIGSIRAVYVILRNRLCFDSSTIKIILGEAMALSLEFKLGAEIIKTVVVQSMDELLILCIIVVLRVILTFVIHWEVKNAGIAKNKCERKLHND
ncbi:MAG: DUF1622 domain-containing protein [Tissierellia bacterium]|nr:DUF1622 domain-containing protein [Tissierellia bacterium]